MNLRKKSMLLGVFTLSLMIIGIFSLPTTTTDSFKIKSDERIETENHKISPSSANITSLSTTININGSATGSNAHNWAWAVTQGFCNGTGTQQDPYVIENFEINAQTIRNAITINDSNDVYFVIRNNIIYNSSIANYGSGIYLNNCSKGEIYENEIFETYFGICVFWFSHDIWIHDNQFGKLGEIPNNTSISIYHLVTSCLVSENKITGGKYGIYIYDQSSNNVISNNIINNLSYNGIIFSANSLSNIVNGNCIYNCLSTGISAVGQYSLIFDNCFANNGINALGWSGSYMNNSLGGNYYSDYNGSDANHDGFGDTPYGNSGYELDYLPLMNYNPVILDKPNDVTYKLGTSVDDLTWNVLDFSYSSLTYDVYCNGNAIENNVYWYSGHNISVPISGLPVGSYQYKIILNDGNSGSATDVVSVTVINPISNFNSTSNSNSTSSSKTTPNNNSTETTKGALDSFLGVLNQYSFLISTGIIAIAIIIYGVLKRPRTAKNFVQKTTKSKKMDRE